MAKQKGQPSVQNRHIYSRASYLYQAARYLATQHVDPSSKTPSNHQQNQHSAADVAQQKEKATQNLSRQMVTDMRAITQKLLIRQSPELKRTVCKFCSTLQIEGQTCASTIENPSKGGKKPWADVLVISCHTCGRKKRFPLDAPRQLRRPHRPKAEAEAEKETVSAQDTEMSVDAVT